ncbi:acyltransferase family protein [Salinispora tropica]|uniref:Acyltransferase 3 n=1 Tax=Salinispora tropica (strain ATCC BAA-916 / DSM 44818 / JCM 13857 / NBRC 105044 / CNB-440) TaxID=369723 RepID=A4X968_SALTO|nr:acyltransferase [Salinispora tropica]ABP55429.1 acyltransferase 3 [Salinispora tropica CNB-440]
MGRLRRLAAATPASRNRYLDMLRALAIIMVVIGHWSVVDIGHDANGQPTARSALPDLPWAYPVTWAVQVMPIFFLVGGYANAASLTSHRRRGGDATGWLLGRSARLLRPTSVLVLGLAAAGLAARLGGADPSLVRTVVYFATIPLWFLAAYLLVVPLTPVMYALHRRYGLLVPVALAALVAAGDLTREIGLHDAALPNYLFGWLAIHQVGFAWYDADKKDPDATAPRGRSAGLRTRRLPLSRQAGWTALLGGLAVAVLLTGPGPYPVSMINIPGERLNNAAPPSLALLAVSTAQLGLLLLLRRPAQRWLRRDRPWMAVIAVNSVVLTVFLWHLSAAILAIGALDAVGLLPTPAAGSAAWLAWRIPWVLILGVFLAVLVAIFGPVEARTSRPPAARAPSPPSDDRAKHRSLVTGRGVLAVAAFVAVVAALVINATAPRDAPLLLGLPVPALVAYLAGAGTLRFLRSGWGTRG